jgi:hypothetical protein
MRGKQLVLLDGQLQIHIKSDLFPFEGESISSTCIVVLSNVLYVENLT